MSEGNAVQLKYHELANLFPLIEEPDLNELSRDIASNGLLTPILLFDGEILDGRNRYRACKLAGVKPVFETYTGDNPLGHVISLNLQRRHLSESQRAMVASKIANLNKSDAARIGHGATANLQSHTRAAAAQMLNVSERTVNAAKKVQTQGAPELVSWVESGKVSVSAASEVATRPREEQAEIVAKGEKEILRAAKEIRAERAVVRRAERVQKITSISKGNNPLKNIKEQFPVLYADPPWRYEYAETENRAIENHYPTMPLDEIKALDIPAITTDDCVLFMWATSPKLADSMAVLAAWGFEYKTCAIWDKQKIGMGYYFRQQHELLLVATKGNPPAPLPANRPSSVFSYARGPHSAKPLEVYSLIESMYPEFAKLEMFSRTPRNGWSAWGNQSK